MFRSPSTRREPRAGFTAVELVILLVILAVVAFALLPTVIRARMAARRTMSMNNLSQLGKAMKYYEGLGQGNLKPVKWEDTLKPFIDGTAEVFTCPLRDKQARNGGVYSYALNTRIVDFGAGDPDKIAIVTSDYRLIDIETKKCVEGKPVITGEPVARQDKLALALMYGGNVRGMELAEIDLADPSYKRLVTWWLPAKEKNTICGEVIVIDTPDDAKEDAGLEKEK